MTLKPIPPVKYDGSADSKSCHHFMTESTAHVKDGNIPEKEQIFIAEHYLTGKGGTFYTEEVAPDPYSWRLREFFKRLFIFCFPMNEMWSTIGERNDGPKVNKFWKGLRKDFQPDLWKDKLIPEVSTLKQVVAAAKVLEISRSVMTGPKETKPGKHPEGTVQKRSHDT